MFSSRSQIGRTKYLLNKYINKSIKEVWNGAVQNECRRGQLEKNNELLPDISKYCTFPSKGHNGMSHFI